MQGVWRIHRRSSRRSVEVERTDEGSSAADHLSTEEVLQKLSRRRRSVGQPGRAGARSGRS